MLPTFFPSFHTLFCSSAQQILQFSTPTPLITRILHIEYTPNLDMIIDYKKEDDGASRWTLLTFHASFKNQQDEAQILVRTGKL